MKVPTAFGATAKNASPWTYRIIMVLAFLALLATATYVISDFRGKTSAGRTPTGTDRESPPTWTQERESSETPVTQAVATPSDPVLQGEMSDQSEVTDATQ